MKWKSGLEWTVRFVSALLVGRIERETGFKVEVLVPLQLVSVKWIFMQYSHKNIRYKGGKKFC